MRILTFCSDLILAAQMVRPTRASAATVATKSIISRRAVSCNAASLQFIKVQVGNACHQTVNTLSDWVHLWFQDVDEPSIPEVKMMRARNGGSGSAAFIFENPSIFQATGEEDEHCSPLLALHVQSLQVSES